MQDLYNSRPWTASRKRWTPATYVTRHQHCCSARIVSNKHLFRLRMSLIIDYTIYFRKCQCKVRLIMSGFRHVAGQFPPPYNSDPSAWRREPFASWCSKQKDEFCIINKRSLVESKPNLKTFGQSIFPPLFDRIDLRRLLSPIVITIFMNSSLPVQSPRTIQ